MIFVALVVAAVAFASPTFAFSFQVSRVEQCRPVTVSFDGNDGNSVLPSWLVFVPFNGVPTSIPVPNDTTVSSGITVTNLPFAVGDTFVVTLEDDLGKIMSNTSDIISVLPSTPPDNGCLPMAMASSPSPYIVTDALQQCKNFTIRYDLALISKAPCVKMFNANGPGLELNATSDDPAWGIATYLLPFPRKRHVVFVFDGDAGHIRSTALLTVGGTSNSSQACLVGAGVMTAANSDNSDDKDKSRSITSRTIIIIGSTITGAIFIAFLCGVVSVLHHRKLRNTKNSRFEPVRLVNGPSTPPSLAVSFPLKGNIENPPYTSDQVISPTTIHFPEERGTSRSQRNPPHLSRQPSSITAKFTVRSQGKGISRASSFVSSSHISLNSLDIEGMLNYASTEGLPSGEIQSVSTTPTGPPPPVVESPFYRITPPLQLRPFQISSSARNSIAPSLVLDPTYRNISSTTSRLPLLSRNHPFRGRPDVPSGPVSILSSRMSNDLFLDNNSQKRLKGSGAESSSPFEPSPSPLGASSEKP